MVAIRLREFLFCCHVAAYGLLAAYICVIAPPVLMQQPLAIATSEVFLGFPKLITYPCAVYSAFNLAVLWSLLPKGALVLEKGVTPEYEVRAVLCAVVAFVQFLCIILNVLLTDVTGKQKSE